MMPLRTSRSAKETVDPAGQMGSQPGILLARHCLHQGHRGGAPGCIVDHENEVALARDHAYSARLRDSHFRCQTGNP
jgi:hypothetical protein